MACAPWICSWDLTSVSKHSSKWSGQRLHAVFSLTTQQLWVVYGLQEPYYTLASCSGSSIYSWISTLSTTPPLAAALHCNSWLIYMWLWLFHFVLCLLTEMRSGCKSRKPHLPFCPTPHAIPHDLKCNVDWQHTLYDSNRVIVPGNLLT